MSCYLGDDGQLPVGWAETLPEVDHAWISKGLFQLDRLSGSLDIKWDRFTNQWLESTEPLNRSKNQLPSLDNYFSSRLLLWVPSKLYDLTFSCSNGHEAAELVYTGMYPQCCRVVDIDSLYNMVGENLRCGMCNEEYVSWSDEILSQLPAFYRAQFPVVLTDSVACDNRVVRMMRDNQGSPSQVCRYVSRSHRENWTQKCSLYQVECEEFVKSNSKQLISAKFVPPPDLQPLPDLSWFVEVFCRDVTMRSDQIKASITSVLGNVLKIHSIQLGEMMPQGVDLHGTAWSYCVGNEFGQILNNILIADDDNHSVQMMVRGIIKRYEDADMLFPKVLYTDWGCCGESNLRKWFGTDVQLKLDVWSWVQRFTEACTSTSHPMYQTFVDRMLSCIFKWNSRDIQKLKAAKLSDLIQTCSYKSTQNIDNLITKQELASHCRRTTRGVKQTTTLLKLALQEFADCQSAGIPLFDSEKLWSIWRCQRCHIPCIQDPEGTQLYIPNGDVRKGGRTLPTYRCVRGLDSLKNYHKYLHTILPVDGETSGIYYHSCLLNGISHWNSTRTTDNEGVEKGMDGLSLDLTTHNDVKLYGIHTDELVGLEYLYKDLGHSTSSLSDISFSNFKTIEDNKDGSMNLCRVLCEDRVDPTICAISIEDEPSSEHIFISPDHKLELDYHVASSCSSR